MNLSDSDVRAVLAGFNVEKTAEITTKEYDAVIQSMRDYSTKF
ncbi:MAG: hypothetical protein PUP91_37895 [Rhizonema sp. PD37]|nr:hypothetical protein [Rhizonema sp. PD37]